MPERRFQASVYSPTDHFTASATAKRRNNQCKTFGEVLRSGCHYKGPVRICAIETRSRYRGLLQASYPANSPESAHFGDP